MAYETDFPDCCGISVIAGLTSIDNAESIKRCEEEAKSNNTGVTIVSLTDGKDGNYTNQIERFTPILKELKYRRTRRFTNPNTGNRVEIWTKRLDNHYIPPDDDDYSDGDDGGGYW